MRKRRTQKVALIGIADAIAFATLVLVADAADASGALFRARRIWWFSNTDSWTSGYVIPPSGMSFGMAPAEPPATAYVGETAGNPRFTAPKSFIKNTTYFWSCGPPPGYCYPGYPESKGWYSYWNAKGSFRPQNPNAPTTTTTVRFATTMSNPDSPPTGMGAPVTPTTTWGGRYDFSRGGSIMIWPGVSRFGGTMRFFSGPNERWYATTYSRREFRTSRAIPLSQQKGTGAEMKLGEVTEIGVGLRYPLQNSPPRKIVIGSTPNGAPEYYVKMARYLVTHAPYTTGMARAWEPNGNTNTIQTVTGYDNRTPAGLNGTISMVHPRLVHSYLVSPPTSGVPIKMVWSSARMRAIDFRFLPEPTAIGMLTAGISMLAALNHLRRWPPT